MKSVIFLTFFLVFTINISAMDGKISEELSRCPGDNPTKFALSPDRDCSIMPSGNIVSLSRIITSKAKIYSNDTYDYLYNRREEYDNLQKMTYGEILELLEKAIPPCVYNLYTKLSPEKKKDIFWSYITGWEHCYQASRASILSNQITGVLNGNTFTINLCDNNLTALCRDLPIIIRGVDIPASKELSSRLFLQNLLYSKKYLGVFIENCTRSKSFALLCDVYYRPFENSRIGYENLANKILEDTPINDNISTSQNLGASVESFSQVADTQNLTADSLVSINMAEVKKHKVYALMIAQNPGLETLLKKDIIAILTKYQDKQISPEQMVEILQSGALGKEFISYFKKAGDKELYNSFKTEFNHLKINKNCAIFPLASDTSKETEDIKYQLLLSAINNPYKDTKTEGQKAERIEVLMTKVGKIYAKKGYNVNNILILFDETSGNLSKADKCQTEIDFFDAIFSLPESESVELIRNVIITAY